MKLYLKAIAPIFILFSLSSCLKDKGYTNQQYGLNDLNSVRHVSFVQSYEKDGNKVVGIFTFPVEEDYDYFVLNISGGKTTSDVTVNLVIDNTQITEFNAANGTAYLPLPSANYVMPLSITYPAGTDFLPVKIKLKKGGLDVTKAYALGIKITGTSDPAIALSSNANKRLISFLIKNKYDGIYQLKGYHNRGANGSPPNYTFPFTTEVEMWTTGPSSVAMFWPDGGDFGQPIGTGPGAVNWYGPAVSPNFQFDPATDLCIGVAGMPANVVPLAMVTNDNVADANPNGPIVNRYEPGPKKMYLVFQYNANDLRRFYDTLTYLRVR